MLRVCVIGMLIGVFMGPTANARRVTALDKGNSLKETGVLSSVYDNAVLIKDGHAIQKREMDIHSKLDGHGGAKHKLQYNQGDSESGGNYKWKAQNDNAMFNMKINS